MIKIKCENCRNKLNPYLLRQMSVVDKMDCYEVECPNCNYKNVLTRQGYLHVKEDWVMPKLKIVNNKLPSEMNVIFCSLERCGISWVIRGLSEYHKEMFNKPIHFGPENAEISPQKAKKDRFIIHKGWNNVYNLDPQLLLDKCDSEGEGYDRVVVIQRDKETLMKVQEIYWNQEGIWDKHLEKLKDNALKMYDIVYKDIEDPRYIKVSLENLNLHPTATLNELMDFLNFPSKGRPPVIGFKPQWFERNWEAVSSIYEKDYKFTKRLGRIQDHFRIVKDGFLEYLTDIGHSEIHLENVLVLGPSIHKGCHMSENLYWAFKKKGINTRLLGLEELGWGKPTMDMYKHKRSCYMLSKAIDFIKDEMVPDLVLVDEPAWYFYNDVRNIPSFYFQREFKRPPAFYYPDIAFFWHSGFSLYFKKMFASHWAANTPKITEMFIAVNLDNFEPKEKKYKGISLIEGREVMQECVDMNELTGIANLYQTIQEMQGVIDQGIRYINGEMFGELGLSDDSFREVLPQCEAMFVHIPIAQYVSRRILEAMACKVICIIKIQNEEHEKILYRMGFKEGEHYIKIDDISELKEMNDKWKYSGAMIEMAERAYDVVLHNHTYDHRAEEIIGYYKDWKIRDRGTVIE